MKSIAMVGADSPLTLDDWMRLDVAVQHGWVRDYRPEDLDVINLSAGRDFLKESNLYGAVIVHSVFHTRPEFMKTLNHAKAAHASVRTSPRHSVENWRKRLAASGAETIVVWELKPFALSGWQLNDLAGYRIHHRDFRATVYRRKS
jgi:hypothetical protein